MSAAWHEYPIAQKRESRSGHDCRFVSVPYGTTVHDRERAIAEANNAAHSEVVSAGRSGRDYWTLAGAIKDLPCRLRIICDLPVAPGGDSASDQLTVDGKLFWMGYIKALAGARFVVVPLSQDDVSAGQMVLLQARALGKAAIISRTRTTVEYATDGEDALLVGIGNVPAMRAAISRLLADTALRNALERAALQRFEHENSTEAYARNLTDAVAAAMSEVSVKRFS